MFFRLLCLTFFAASVLFSEVYPIGFSIPESKIVDAIPEKTSDFAFIIPGRLDTYIYDSESEYYRGYQKSYFAVTCKRGGWDCLRHYEILANGCIPYFVGLEQCDPQSLPFLPKDLILEAMHLDGVSYLKIDPEKFDKVKYNEILQKLLAYTREHLTSRHAADYLLDTLNYSGKGTVLFLNGDLAGDYLRCLTLIGLKEVLAEKIIDFPKVEHLYKGYPDSKKLYGKGFSYTQILDDLPIDRNQIEERIKNREFELIIYGSIHRGLPFHDLVCQVYDPEKIVYLCGEDLHRCEYLAYLHSSPLFLREFENNDL